MQKCEKCGLKGTHNSLSVPQFPLLNSWLCVNCYDKYLMDLEIFHKNYLKTQSKEIPKDHKFCECPVCGDCECQLWENKE